MADKIIAIYCFFDDLLKAMGKKTPVRCKLNDAKIITIALMAALSFYGNQAAACDYMHHHHGLRMIDKSGFNRRLHQLEATLLVVFRGLRTSLKERNTTTRYMIDRPAPRSFPVSVCRNCRIGSL